MFQTFFNPFTELASLSLFLIMLYWLRRSIGIIPMYLLLGLLFIFGQVALLPVFGGSFTEEGKLSTLAYGFLLLPVVMMFLIIYEEEGTLEAQRFIFGMLMAIIGFIYLTQLILGQYRLKENTNIPEFIQLLLHAKLFILPLLVMTFTHLTLLLILPVGYQLLRNIRLPSGITIFIHIVFFVIVSNVVQRMLDSSNCVELNANIIISWAGAIVAICIMAQIYLTATGTSYFEHRRPLGILSTLIQHLQTASRMRQSVEEWAGRYQTVFDNSMEMIFLLDKNGAVLNANKSAVTVLESRLYSTGFILTPLISSEDGTLFDWEKAWNDIQTTVSSEHQFRSFRNMVMKFPDGKTLNIDFNISPARLNDIDMAVMIMRDTTSQHIEELERNKLEEQLMQSQKMESVGILAGGVAHDFNNLLLGIQASAEVLAKQQLDASGRAMLGNIDNASRRAADLINKLLGFARKGKYEEQLLDLADVAQKAVDLFDIGLKDINFKFIVVPEPLMIMGDETQLQQVILNLLLNARDALKPGKKDTRKITLRLDRAKEDMPSWKQRPSNAGPANKYVIIRIKDTGIGMTQETQNRMFDPFFSTKGQKGTGLGLSMAYGCVTHHHGWIAVESSPDNGCEINIYLPAATVSETWN